MPLIRLETRIKAPLPVCFDLSRDIDLHRFSMKHTQEKAVAGITSGLIGLHQTVSWRARHFGIRMGMTVVITEMLAPQFFVDEMVSGPFKAFRHIHTFAFRDGYTIMTDELVYRSPLGFIGKLADKLFLEKYMRSLLEQRNLVIKQQAETLIA